MSIQLRSCLKKGKGCKWKQMERTVPSVPRRAPSVSAHKQHWDSFLKPKSAFSCFQGNTILLLHAAVNLSPKDLLNSHCYDFQPPPQPVIFNKMQESCNCGEGKTNLAPGQDCLEQAAEWKQSHKQTHSLRKQEKQRVPS